MNARTLLLILILAPLAQSAPTDPPVPVGGFGVNLIADCATHTYTDAYQTYYDLRVPDVPPPVGGWPLIFIAHGGGGNKNVYAGTAEGFARLGYAALTCDWRGQGTSMVLLNDPLVYGKTRDGLREIIDLFEILEAMEANHPTEIDFDRIGVTGFSQGGIVSWNAVVHSGALPPPNPWGRVLRFPDILAAVPQGCPGPTRGTTGLQTAFGVKTVEGVFGAGGSTHYDPSTQPALQAAILAEDYASYQALTSSGVFDEAALLAQSRVPVYYYASYDDPRIRTTSGVTAFEAFNGTKRMQLGTGHHGSPANRRDDELFRVNRRRWFDRFLKSDINGVDTEPTVVAATTPAPPPAYNALDSLWDFRRMTGLDQGVVTERLHLTPPGLQAPTPAAPSSQTLIHTPPPFVDMAWWTTNLPGYATTLALIPLNGVQWDSTPLGEDRHVIGEIDVHLEVVSSQAEFQLNVVILDVSPLGNVRNVTKRDVTKRDHVPGTTSGIDLSLDVQSYVFRAGHRIRLVVENLARRDTDFPGGDRLKRLPVFSGFSVDIVSGPGLESFLDIPVLPFADPVLSMHPIEQDVDAMDDQRFNIHTDTSRAGDAYVLLVTASGSSPGVNVAGVQIPINPDALTSQAIADVNIPPQIDTLGVLDPDGRAEPAILMPPSVPAFLRGVSLDFAAIVVTPLGDVSVTEAERMTFR